MNVFIILNYNDLDNCMRLARSVKEFSCIDRVIIVDNASTDDTAELEALESEGMILIRTDKNGGYSYGNNRGAEYAVKELGADRLIFSNTDVTIDEEALAASLDAVGKDGIAYCAPLMQYSYNDEPEPVAPYCGNWFSSLMTKTIVGTLIRKARRKKKHPTGIHDVNIACGALFAITAEAFCAAGMFDENVFLYCEEDILFYKLRKLGYRVTLDGSHKYIHEHGAVIKKTYDKFRRFRLGARSEKYFWFDVVKINPVSKFFYTLIYGIILAERFLIYGIFR